MLSQQTSIPAPIRGWNTRDPLAQMDPLCAPVLINWYPRQGELLQRGGSTEYAFGLPSECQRLIPYNDSDGTQFFYAATPDGVFDITGGGDVSAGLKYVLTDGNVSYVNFANSAGDTILVGANGVDTPFYHSTALGWNAMVSSGVTAADLSMLWIFKRRIWATCKNTSDVYYLDIDSIGGAWSRFPVGALLKKGGYIVAGATWTVDGGSGSDDLLVMISSEGEVLVYAGSTPTSASSFQLVGVYYLGIPLSRFCFTKIGGDLAVATHRGLFPLTSSLLQADESSKKAMSDQIQPTWVGLAQDRIGSNPWQCVVYPTEEAFVVNVPDAELNEPTQIVFNLTTGAPTSFQSWAALSIELFQEKLYFGTEDGKVFLAWNYEAVSDSGADVVATAQQAYNYIIRGKISHIELMRFQLSFTAGVQIEWAIGVDFQGSRRYGLAPRDTTFLPAVWDTSLWDVSYWEVQARRDRNWRSFMHAPGYALSLYLRTTTKFARIEWSATDLRVVRGSGLG